MRRWLPLGLALGIQGALTALVRALPPGWEEPGVLRWARALEAHPVRTVLALALALWALRPLPRAPLPPAAPRPGLGPDRGAGQRPPQDL